MIQIKQQTKQRLNQTQTPITQFTNMQYYITTPELAQGISAIEAQKKGCIGVTSFWWSIINHPTNGQSAIVFQDSDLIKPNDTLIDGVNPMTGEPI